MTVSAVKKNDASGGFGISNYIISAGAGALTGYALKYAIPLNAAEKNDANYKIELKNIENGAHDIKLAEINTIKAVANKTSAEDTFIKMHELNKLNVIEINKLHYPLTNQVMDLFAAMQDKSEYFVSRKTKALNAYTKNIRSASTFILIGLIAAVVGTFVNHLVKSLKGNKTN